MARAICSTVGAGEERAHRQPDLEGLTQRRKQGCGHQRMAAEIEEAVGHADPRDPERVLPDSGDGLLDFVARRNEIAVVATGIARHRQATAIDLSVRRQRQNLQEDVGRWQHVAGEEPAQSVLHLLTQARIRAAGGHHIGDQAWVSRPVDPHHCDGVCNRRHRPQRFLDLSEFDPGSRGS